MIFDTHAHYDMEDFTEDRDELLGSMEQNGIGRIVNAASDLASWDAILALTARYPILYGSVGVHPDDVGDLNEEQFARMEEIAAMDKIQAIGEIGLDYYHAGKDREVQALQKAWFIRQLELAQKTQMPVMIHSREAAAETMVIMKEHAQGLKGVIHCYSYSTEMAAEYVKMGFYLGIGGVITFKNGKKLKQVVQDIPLTSLVLETDCPYLAPVPFRGKRNSSLLLPYIAEEIAEIKGITAEEVAAQTWQNALDLYNMAG